MNYCSLPLIAILIFLSTELLSQEPSKSKSDFPVIYVNSGGGFLSKGWSAKTGATIIFKKGSGLGVSYRYTSFTAEQLPADYDPGSGFFGSRSNPKDMYSIVSAGYAHRLSKAESNFQFLSEVGIASVKHEYNTFTKNTSPGSGWFTAPSNYVTTEHKKNMVGFYVSPQVSYVLTNWVGIQLSGVAIYSKVKVVTGAELSVILGKLR